MRVTLLAALLFHFCLPLVSSAACRSKASCCHASHSHCAAPAAACAYAISSTSACQSTSPCNSCGPARCCTPHDYANFNQNFYAEFYARNQWYVEAKKKEAAEKRKAYEAVH